MRALISVYDKTGVVEFSERLVDSGFELISTGGTHRTLSEEGGLLVKQVSDVTGSPEILEGRVKTLHPAIHAGLLARRDSAGHLAECLRLMGKLDAHPVARGAIVLLSEQRMIAILPEVLTVCRRLRDERLGVTSVTVISARAIDSADHGAWESALSKVAGTPVRIDYGTDPSLIGGAVARVGSVLYDGSVRTSLQRIRKSLLGE